MRSNREKRNDEKVKIEKSLKSLRIKLNLN